MVKKHYGIRTDSFKLIHYYSEVKEWEMFDLKNDPQEMNNIYNSLDFKTKQAELHQLLIELRAKYKEVDEFKHGDKTE